MALTVPEICEEIRADFKRRRITHQIAADKIGTTKQTVSNQISGRKRFSQNMAKKFCDAFGYSIAWLLYGEGEMFAPGRGYAGRDSETGLPYFVGNFDGVFKEGRTIRMAERLIEILNNKVAISAFRAYINEDYEEYEKLRDMLENAYSYNVPLITNNPAKTQAFRRMREYFTDVETKAAKELVIIEQKAALGEIIDVDAELERFKRRIILIKDSYKDEALKAHPELKEEEYLPETERQHIKELIPEKYRKSDEE